MFAVVLLAEPRTGIKGQYFLLGAVVHWPETIGGSLQAAVMEHHQFVVTGESYV